MAQIKQVGIGRKSTGTIDGITYYVLNGKTYARSAPNMPASVFNTTEARIRQAIFKFIQMHLKLHLRTIRQTVTAKNGSPSNRYYSLNHKVPSSTPPTSSIPSASSPVPTTTATNTTTVLFASATAVLSNLMPGLSIATAAAPQSSASEPLCFSSLSSSASISPTPRSLACQNSTVASSTAKTSSSATP